MQQARLSSIIEAFRIFEAGTFCYNLMTSSLQMAVGLVVRSRRSVECGKVNISSVSRRRQRILRVLSWRSGGCGDTSFECHDRRGPRV